MPNGHRRPLPLRPRSGAAAARRATAGPARPAAGPDILDPRFTRRAIQQSVREQMAREEAPLRQWLDANIDTLRGVAMPDLLARLRRNVPEARELPDMQVEGVVRQWANQHGISIPQLSLIPLPGAPGEPERRSAEAGGDSGLASAIGSQFSIPTSIEIERPHGRTVISASGVTVELMGEGRRVGSSVSWGGTMGLFTEVGDVRFQGSLSDERWSISLSIGGAPAPDPGRLGEIFREAEHSLRAIAREIANTGNLSDLSADAISPHLAPVKRAVSAVQGIAASEGRRVSFGLSAGGPAPSAAPEDEGVSVSAMLTVRF